jgi:hypothetical protein
VKAGLSLREAEIVPLVMEPVDLGETSVSGYHSTMAHASKAGLGAPDVAYEKPEGVIGISTSPAARTRILMPHINLPVALAPIPIPVTRPS